MLSLISEQINIIIGQQPSSHPSPLASQPLWFLHLCLASGYMEFVLQDGESPLLAASFNGHPDVVKTLIEAGANVNQTDKVCIPWHCFNCIIPVLC